MRTHLQNEKLSHYTISFGYSLAAACLINAALVVAKEKSPRIMAWMQRLTGSHWISHCIIILTLFLLLGLLPGWSKFFGRDNFPICFLVGVIAAAVASASLVIFGYYFLESVF